MCLLVGWGREVAMGNRLEDGFGAWSLVGSMMEESWE